MFSYFILITSIYTGLISTLCLQRIMLSLVRHGHMSWQEYLYNSKAILIFAVFFSFHHFKKNVDENSVNLYKNFFYKNMLLIFALVVATRLVFSQFSSLYSIFVSPFVLLFFRW